MAGCRESEPEALYAVGIAGLEEDVEREEGEEGEQWEEGEEREEKWGGGRGGGRVVGRRGMEEEP